MTLDSTHPVIGRCVPGESPGAAAIPEMVFPRRAILAHRADGARSRWCGWGSWGGPGRGRVQICHKGAPGRDRPRRKARNTNDSSRALRPDPGLCGRFGQPAPLQVRGEGVSGRFLNVIWIETAAAREEGSRGPAGDHGGRPGDRTGPVTAPSVPLGRRPDPRDRRPSGCPRGGLRDRAAGAGRPDVRFALERTATPAALSRAKCTSQRGRGRPRPPRQGRHPPQPGRGRRRGLRRCSSGRTGTSSAAPDAGCSPPGCRRRRGRPRRRRRGSRAAWWSRR